MTFWDWLYRLGPGWPNERGWLVAVAGGIFVYVLSLVAFVPDLDKSQLFTALASGVGGAVFRDVIGMWTASTKAGAEMAQKAMDKMPDHRQPAGTVADPVNVKDVQP